MVPKALTYINGTLGDSIKVPESSSSARFSYVLFSGCLPPKNPDKRLAEGEGANLLWTTGIVPFRGSSSIRLVSSATETGSLDHLAWVPFPFCVCPEIEWIQLIFFIILPFSSTANESDESDEIPSDVDLSDPFFSQEIDAGISHKNKTDKASTGKTKKKRKRTVLETEEDRKAKVRRSFSFIDSSYMWSNTNVYCELYISARTSEVFLQVFNSTFRARDMELNSRRTLLTNTLSTIVRRFP